MKDRLLGRWMRYRNQQHYRRMSTTDVRASIQVLSGNIRKNALSACAIVRDEMYFLPSFLRHHRQLGVEQFLFLDDGSEDDSREYISKQPDCILLQSSISYGTKDVLDCYPDGQRSCQRGGLWLKHHLTQNLVNDNFILYLDADEFLILPPRYPSLNSLIKELKAQNIKTTTAALVELFPESIGAMAQQQLPPNNLTKLLSQCGHYDHHALIQHRHMGGVKAVGQSATTRLFNQAGITAIGPKEKSASAIHKMPLFQKGDDNWLIGSHYCKRKPDHRLILTLLHFKFSPDLYRRVEMALRVGGHNRNSEKYQQYEQLLQPHQPEYAGCLLGPDSRRYTGAEELLACGLMQCRL